MVSLLTEFDICPEIFHINRNGIMIEYEMLPMNWTSDVVRKTSIGILVVFCIEVDCLRFHGFEKVFVFKVERS